MEAEGVVEAAAVVAEEGSKGNHDNRRVKIAVFHSRLTHPRGLPPTIQTFSLLNSLHLHPIFNNHTRRAHRRLNSPFSYPISRHTNSSINISTPINNSQQAHMSTQPSWLPYSSSSNNTSRHNRLKRRIRHRVLNRSRPNWIFCSN